MNHAHRRYYAHHVGRWAGTLRLVITDWRAFRAAPVPWIERPLMVVWSWWPAWLPFARLETEVLPEVDGVVVHTTALRVLGVVLLRSVERFVLDDDGVSLAFERDLAAGPPGFTTRVCDSGAAVVDTDAMGARYTFPWYGDMLDQRTHVAGDALVIDQRSAWSSATVTLRRRRDGR